MSSSWTSKPYFSGGCAFLKGFSRGSFGLLCALLLTSCGFSSPSGYSGSTESTTQSDTLQPLTVPPNSADRPPAPGTTGAPKTADGLPALQVKGTNTALFSQRMSDEADRLDRLENAVQELRNDFDAMAPAIVRLVAIEGDIQALIQQLEAITGTPDSQPYDDGYDNTPIYPQATHLPPIPQDIPANEDAASQQAAPPSISSPSAPVAQERAEMQDGSGTPAPEPLPPVNASGAAAPPAATPPATPAQVPQVITPPAAMASSVMDIRIGEHPGKTRIVLDVRGKTGFTADLDNQEKILVAELPEAGWNATAQKTLSSSPLIASYRTEALDNGGTLLIVQLKKSASIAYKGAMDDPGKGQRLIIDLTASN
jgi:N-acetylmuramoyl-L-alanine amidase